MRCYTKHHDWRLSDPVWARKGEPGLLRRCYADRLRAQPICWAALYTQKSSSGNAFPGTIKERLRSWLNLPKESPKPRFGSWGRGDVQCGPYFTETQYLLHGFNILLVSFLFAPCPRYLVSPTNAHQLFLQIIQLITRWELTEISQRTGTWGTFVLLVGLRIAGVTSNPSVCFYFHARKGNFCSPTDTKAELPCLQCRELYWSCSYFGGWTAFCDFSERSGGINLLLLVRAIQLQWQD